MRRLERDAFTILHYPNILDSATARAGANLLTNGDFENGFTGWTNSGFSLVTGSTPPASGKQAAQAQSSGTPDTAAVSTLESARVTVTAGGAVYLGLLFGAAEETGSGDATPNNLIVTVRFWAGAVGGSVLKEQTLYAAAVKGNNSALRSKLKRFDVPATANYASVYIENRHYGGPAGTPAGTIVDDVFLAREVIETSQNLIHLLKHQSVQKTEAFRGLSYSRNFRVGDKQAKFDLFGDPIWLWSWLTSALLHEIKIVYDNGTRFDGIVWRVEGTINGVPFAVSADWLANRVFVPCQERIRPYQVEDAVSIAHYGEIQYLHGETFDTIAEARRFAKHYLFWHKDARPVDDFPDGRSGESKLSVTCLGPWATLKFLYGITGPGEMEMAQAVATHKSSILNQVRARGNVFISSDYTLVNNLNTVVGPSTRKEVRNRTAQEEVTRYLEEGTDAGLAIVSGVWNRQFVLKARPTTIDYVSDLVDGEVVYYDAGGSEVSPVDVVPGRFLRRARPVPEWSYYADVGRDAKARFLEEVEVDAEKGGVTTRAMVGDTVDKRLARVK
jgi:hypothetical protein